MARNSLEGGAVEMKNWNPQNAHISHLYLLYMPNFNPSTQLRKGELHTTSFIRGLKRLSPPPSSISPHNWRRRLIFEYNQLLLILYRLVLKQTISAPRHPFPPKFGHNWVLNQGHTHSHIYIYPIYSQSNPIAEIWPILIVLQQLNK